MKSGFLEKTFFRMLTSSTGSGVATLSLGLRCEIDGLAVVLMCGGISDSRPVPFIRKVSANSRVFRGS